jgi:Omp85 superfamily domain
MGALRVVTFRIATLGTVAFVPLDADGQERVGSPGGKRKDSVTTTIAGRHYAADGFKPTLLGAGWRDVWVTPVSVPSLELTTFAGGLKVLERGGGYQSITLHLQEESGWKEWRFRSVNKFPGMTLPPAFRETAAGTVIQDQVSALFPGSALPVPPLLEAINALTVEPKLYRLADDPRLGVYRDTMAGMLGTMELKGAEAPNDEPGFAGSRKITGSEGFFEDLRSSRAHRFDEHEFLAIRLIDLLINDGDRTPDNSDFARFGDSTGYRWRAIARDRDWAFMDARGLVNRFIVKSIYPKTVEFRPTYDMKGLTYSTHFHDRRLLQRLTRDDFAAVARRVQAAITDDVIEQAIARLPAAWREQTTASARLRSALRSRRDAIPAVAMALYQQLATDVDIYGTEDDERAEIVRHQDGSVTVTVGGDDDVRTTASSPEAAHDQPAVEAAAEPFYQRTFIPSETKEVRVYLLDGEDHVTVRGAASGAIVVRVIGGYDDDVLADSAGGGATHLYDADGENEVVAARGTHVNARPWREPTVANGMRVWGSWRPDWGGDGGWGPAISYWEGANVIVGVSRSVRSYGFRRLPHLWEIKGTALIGTGNGRFALHADADYRRENSPVAFTLAARASQLDAFRFYGYGNETPSIGHDMSLVNQTVLAFEPAVVLHLGWRERETSKARTFAETTSQPSVRAVEGRLEAGPVVTWIDPEPVANSPLATLEAPGNDAFGHAGVRASLELDHTDADAVPMRGWKLGADVRGFPPLWNLSQSFATTRADGSVYIPLLPNRAHLAVRGGASMTSGLFPAQYAASIGGWTTLRGYRWQRFSGDASVDGSTELRVPVGTVNLLLRWNAGIFGLADVGRVWSSGESEGGWHKGFGGGVWLEALGRAISVAYARGDEHRFYLKTGLF